MCAAVITEQLQHRIIRNVECPGCLHCLQCTVNVRLVHTNVGCQQIAVRHANCSNLQVTQPDFALQVQAASSAWLVVSATGVPSAHP